MILSQCKHDKQLGTFIPVVEVVDSGVVVVIIGAVVLLVDSGVVVVTVVPFIHC